MHLEKNAGTSVRAMFRAWTPGAVRWTLTPYCSASATLIKAAVARLLTLRTPHIFVEHHCAIDWALPRQLGSLVERWRGIPTSFRSFTILRSPLRWVQSQHEYWHKDVPADLFARGAAEMMLFSDPFKADGAGRFLNLALSNGAAGAARAAPGCPHAAPRADCDAFRRIVTRRLARRD